MLQVDEFESFFRSAIKECYVHDTVEIKKAVFVTDKESSDGVLKEVQAFCSGLSTTSSVVWDILGKSDCSTTEKLLERLQDLDADLIVTYRNLFSDSWKFPHSLGEHLDVMLQKTSIPVLVIPHPDSEYGKKGVLDEPKSTMVVTDHMVNDQSLVQYASAFCSQGTLILSHIEDEYYFQRYLEAIGKVPGLDTELAEEKLSNQLLKEPREYIESVTKALKDSGSGCEVIGNVEFGHQLKDHLAYVESNDIDLLVMNTKDGDQLAMHGLAYPLAVELRQIPLLML